MCFSCSIISSVLISLNNLPDCYSHLSLVGVACSVGEQPIKGLISSGAQARMTVAEALANLALAQISRLEDVKASCNWMWAAKLPEEGAKMYEVCEALCQALRRLGPAIDGGKDSLSMAAKAICSSS